MYRDIFKIRLPREVLADIAEGEEQLPLNLKASQIIKSPVKKAKRGITKLLKERQYESD